MTQVAFTVSISARRFLGALLLGAFLAGGMPLLSPAQAETAVSDKVGLLTGLAKIESDLKLGMLFLKDGLTATDGSHFTHPRAETWPFIKDGLAAAGIADFENLLVTLEAGGDKATVVAALKAVLGAVGEARNTLKPDSRDLVNTIVEQTRAAVAEINATGPTEVTNYQNAWAMLIIARNQVDLLKRDDDPKVVKAAQGIALTLDDVILFMPDPNQPAPITLDPAPYLDALAKLETLAGSV